MAGCLKRERLVVSTSQIDPSLTAVGGSPFVGDMSATGVLIPAGATPAQSRRYLVRCCSLGLGPNQTAFIRSMRHLVWIGVELTQVTGVVHFEQIVTTPGWRFPDGNVSFHLRRVGTAVLERGRAFGVGGPPIMGGGTACVETPNGHGSGILGNITGGVYTSLNGGMPFGEDVAGLGTTRDVRYPPGSTPSQDLDLQVTGPSSVAVFASVWQTNPTTRINWAGSKDIIDGLGPEDRFWVRFDTARYWRVGAEMTVDLCTWDEEGWCPEKTCVGYKSPNIECPHRPIGARELIRP